MAVWIWSLCFIGAIGFFLWQIQGRLRLLLQAKRDDARDYSPTTFAKRIRLALIYGFGQKKFFRGEQPAGIVHVVVFWGFITLGLQVVTMFTRGWFPNFSIPGLGGFYALMKDIFQAAVIVAGGTAMYRWAVSRPKRLYGFEPAENRLRSQSHWEAYLILSFIATIMLSGFFYDAGRIVQGDTAEANWQPISAALAGWLGNDPAFGARVSQAAWWVHNLVILIFLNLLPRSKHFHIITAIPNVFLGKVEPKGRLPKRDFTVDTPMFGRSTPDQFTFKQVLDMFSCTECGRCSSQCPATATGKPLAPRQFLLNLRDTMYGNQEALLKKAAGAEMTFEPVVGEGRPVIDEVIWSCNGCRACEEACPVNIEYVDKIVDIRQHLVQEASRFPAEMSRAFKGMETQSNPWGIGVEERMSWAEGLGVQTLQEKPDAEYLYYVGCAGSYDSNNRKATQSFIRILKEANISFAVLGKSEMCNGDSARRLGNEYLFQSMAEALATTINSFNVKKIIVNCPHCFNTLKNEYPQFGGNWEVIHAASLVGDLIESGKVKMDKAFGKNVVYHDSCNYGRFNDVYDEPRDIVKAVPGATLSEMDRSRETGMCCGAGGGRMWLEEPKDQRVNVLRTEQALEKKPDVIATSCPFCKIMLSSGINEKGLAEKVAVMDVMEIVAQNMATETGTPA